MDWQLSTTDGLRAEHGADRLCQLAGRLEDVLRQNGMPIPPFPEMIWAEESLLGGVEVAVGIAEDGGEPLAYVWPAEKVQFVGMEEMTLDYQPAEGERSVVVLRRYIPPGG